MTFTNKIPIFPDDFEEISKGEYEQAKRENYKHTARIGYKYFKMKASKEIIIKDELSDLKAEILENGWVLLIDGEGHSISLGAYPNARFRVIEKLMEEVKKWNKEP